MALPDQKAIRAILSCMVCGQAGDFAHGHLNAILQEARETDWDEFMEAVENHFCSTNKKDQNRAYLHNLKQKGHPMDAFLLKFKNYTLLAEYDDMWQIELLETNMDNDIITCLILESGRYSSL